MAQIDYERRVIQLKVVYDGPAGSGKTSIVRHIYERTRTPDAEPQVLLHQSPGGGYFDYLPMRLGDIRGFVTQLDLYTVPSGDELRSVRYNLLDAADGVVFVADCREERASANVAAFGELRENLTQHDVALDRLPFVVLLNQCDAPTAVSPARIATPLVAWHPAPATVSVFQCSAVSGEGVFECLKEISRRCLTELKRRA